MKSNSKPTLLSMNMSTAAVQLVSSEILTALKENPNDN
jgi:hypothetical protein